MANTNEDILRSEFLRVAQMLMEEERRPMSPAELVVRAYERKLFSDKRSGRTPHNTMRARLSVHVR